MDVLRAPASSMARMSRRSETPVALKASTTCPLCRSRPITAHAAAVLPEFMQVPARATTGTPPQFQSGSGVQWIAAHPGRDAHALAEIGELENHPEHTRIEGLSQRCVDGVAYSQHAAHVEDLHDVARARGFGDVAGVAEQRLAVAQRAHDDIPAAHARHASAGQFQLVVGGLLVQHLDCDHHALLARNAVADADFPVGTKVRGHGRQFVDDDATHCPRSGSPSGRPRVAAGPPGRAVRCGFASR